jgi:MFS family permease
MVARYRSVLLVPGSPGLILAALAGRLPLGMSSLALLLLVRATHHSYAIAGLAVGAFAFASAAATPLQGRLVDRFGRACVLAPCAVGQALVLITFVLASAHGAGGAALVTLAVLAGALTPPISPTTRALFRELFCDPHVRDTAYALDSVLLESVFLIGPLIVALVVGFSSPEVAVVLAGAVCVIGTALFVRSPLTRDPVTRRTSAPRVAALSNPALRGLLVPVALTGVGMGAMEVGLPSLALHLGSRPATGVLLAAWSVGSITGGLLYGGRRWSSPVSRRYRMLLMVAVLFSAPLILARSIPEGLVCSLLAGLSGAPMFACQYALVSRVVTPGTENEAFAWVAAALVGGLATGSAIGGAVIGPGGVSAPFVISCAALSLAATMAVRAREPIEAVPAQRSAS